MTCRVSSGAASCGHAPGTGQEVGLYMSALHEWRGEPQAIPYGAILICRRGGAVLRTNFDEWRLRKGVVVTVFPNDIVMLEEDAADDGPCREGEEEFLVEMLRYDAAMLREASLQLEHTVYSSLREHRCSRGTPVVTAIIDNMFALLRLYFDQPGCTCVTQLVLLQLKAFFIGFHDYLQRNPQRQPDEEVSRRVRELFDRFMMLVERDYKLARDVNYYADKMSITPKYLTNVVRTVTGLTPKTIIDSFVVLQLKMRLQMSRRSIKEIAWEFNFPDVSFFCRYFKRHTGKSPMQVRDI